MYYLNLYLVQNDGPGITIGMENILVPGKSGHSRHSWLSTLFYKKNVCELLIEEMGQEHAEQIERELKRQVNEEVQIPLPKGTTIEDAITYYTLPSTPAFQLPFLFAIDTSIHNKNYDGIFVSTGPLLNRDDIPDIDSFRKTIDAQKKNFRTVI